MLLPAGTMPAMPGLGIMPPPLLLAAAVIAGLGTMPPPPPDTGIIIRPAPPAPAAACWCIGIKPAVVLVGIMLLLPIIESPAGV
jgi:hypothetical protein